jgi:PRTRC genetic system ThiF family protein
MGAMMDVHSIHPQLLTQQVKVHVIGAGGTGSQMVNNLARLHLALLALGHPSGLHVTLWDDDVVSEANVGRQAFYPCDIGQHKAPTLIHRINIAFGLQWKSEVIRVKATSDLKGHLVIGCVDNRKARAAILAGARESKVNYWLDCGNRLSDSQVVLGEVDPTIPKKRKTVRLPHAADLLPELIDPKLDEKDDVPSCSLADALEKQSLFINSSVALYACNLLSELFRHGQITYHGGFINMKSGRTSPLQIGEETWKRFGYAPKRRIRAKKK